MNHLIIVYSERPTTYKNYNMSAIQIKESLPTKKYGNKFKVNLTVAYFNQIR